MITVTRCSNPAEAMLLKSLLEGNDIPAYVPEELSTQAALDYAGSAGIRVQVDDENAEAARRVLAEAASAEASSDDQPS